MAPNRSTGEKKLIYYTRDYRHFPKAGLRALLYLALLPAPVITLFVLFYPQITSAVSGWTGGVLRSATGAEVKNMAAPFIPGIGPVHYVDIAGTSPSLLFAIMALALCAAALVLLPRMKLKSRAVLIYIEMAIFVQTLSAAFFVFFPEHFPYSLRDYSELYMKQQVAIWITIALLIGLSTALLHAPLYLKCGYFLAAMAYSLVYGVVRYVVYLYILRTFSLLFMATLFFTLGVLFDFMQLVMVYSFFVRRVGERLRTGEGEALWKWS